MTEKNTKNWKEVRDRAESDIDADVAAMDDSEAKPKPKSDADALEHPSYEALEEKLTEAEALAHENWEKSVRAMAELDNVRRRAEKEVSNAHRYGIEKFVEALLPVMDSLEQAMQLADKHDDAVMKEGLELTTKQLLGVFEKFNVAELNPEQQPFNPQEHEAMSMQAVDGMKPNTVVAVFQKGYKLYDRVIRAARVMVSK